MKPIRLLVLGAAVAGFVCVACDSNSNPPPAHVIAFDKNDAGVRFVRSIRESLDRQRRPSNEDVRKLKEIANQYPDEPFIGQVIVAILPGLKDWDGLADYYEHKSQLDDGERVSLARVYIKQANYEGARDTIRPMAESQPKNAEANALLGRALYFFGEYDEASRCYDRVWDAMLAERRYSDITFRAMIYFDQGDAGRAIEILQAALEQSPREIAVHNALGRVLAASGRVEEAQVHSEAASELQAELSLHETQQMVRAGRIFALNRALQSGDSDACQRMIYEYLPDSDPEFQQELYSFLEGIYRAAGREAEIPAVLERARQAARGGN